MIEQIIYLKKNKKSKVSKSFSSKKNSKVIDKVADNENKK